MNRKICKHCATVQPVTNFYKGFVCKTCWGKRGAVWRQANSHKNREYNLRRKYGVDEEWYSQKFHEQLGCCAICGSEDPQGGRRDAKHFCVDHDHGSGAVRALLCYPCNLAIGYLKDRSDLARKVAEYLDYYKIQNSAE